MSDTITLYERCPHGKLEKCDTFVATMRDGIPVSANEVPWVKCPGGRERLFEGVRKKCFEPEWLDLETVIWVEVEVDDDE